MASFEPVEAGPPASALTAMAARPARRAQAPGCLRVVRPIAAGSAPASTDFTPQNCPTRVSRRAFTYDAGQAVARATRDLAVGDVVSGASLFALASLRAGQTLRIQSNIGPVRVEREVTVVAASSPGAAVFVKAADGVVFAAPFPEQRP